MNSTWHLLSTTKEEDYPPLYKGPFWLPIDIFIGVIQSIACFACLMYTLFAYSNIKKSITKSFIILTIICLLFMFMTAITMTINGYYYNAIWWTHTPMTYNTWSLGWLFWSFGQGMSYILFIIRLQTIFKGTSYKLSIYTIIYLSSVIFIYITLWISMTCIPLYLLNKDENESSRRRNITDDELRDVQWYFSFIVPLLDIIITISMIYMFISKLYKLLITQTVNQMENQNDINECDTPSMSFKDRQLMNVSVKVSILCITSLISSILTVIFRGMAYYLNESDQDDGISYVVFNNLQVIWLQIDTVISGICIVLFLPKTKRGYEIFCCCCHKIMSKYYSQNLRKNSIRLHRKRTHSTIATYTDNSDNTHILA